MNKSNTHYKPECSEFHPGFVYERRYDIIDEEGYEDYEWREETVETEDATSQHLSDIFENIECYGSSRVRVKVLDEDDIVGLGWPYLETGFTHIYKKDELYLSISKDHYPGFPYVVIYDDADDPEYTTTFFSGIIKNKSELKRIMQMIQIERPD